MNPTAYPHTASDDLEAAASLDADLREAHEAASLLGTPDLFVAVAHLLARAAADLKEGRQPWGLLDGAHSAICDLRMEHGCEDWTQVPEWTIQACAVEFLWAEERLLREGARRLRDRTCVERETLRKAG